jgi:hypothetical protein
MSDFPVAVKIYIVVVWVMTPWCFTGGYQNPVCFLPAASIQFNAAEFSIYQI